jgi:hypothetical protein
LNSSQLSIGLFDRSTFSCRLFACDPLLGCGDLICGKLFESFGDIDVFAGREITDRLLLGVWL